MLTVARGHNRHPLVLEGKCQRGVYHAPANAASHSGAHSRPSRNPSCAHVLSTQVQRSEGLARLPHRVTRRKRRQRGGEGRSGRGHRTSLLLCASSICCEVQCLAQVNAGLQLKTSEGGEGGLGGLGTCKRIRRNLEGGHASRGRIWSRARVLTPARQGGADGGGLTTEPARRESAQQRT